ncbi:MAG: cytochrome C [Sandaracinaceae bacterium]|nr:cytochrome C [Sandaracinaceae bacterium]
MQIFPKTLNVLPLVLAVATVIGGGAVTFIFWYYFSPANLQVGYEPVQPVPYSHRLHAGELGIDCRYCHANVERSSEAMIPPTQTCMGCHAVVKQNSARLEPVRESFRTGQPVEWVRVHKLPDHAFFNHSVHLNVGVGCVTCHGRVDQMEVVRVNQPLSMGWCLDCHRNPGPSLRPRDGDPANSITNMGWTQTATAEEQQQLAANVHPPQNCSGCHR